MLSLVCRKTLTSIEEGNYYYAGRQLLIWRKTVISMQEDIGKIGEDTNGDKSADLLLLVKITTTTESLKNDNKPVFE